MPLLPRAPRLFAGGGLLGYESQLGSGLNAIGEAAGKVGDALYQNLPPLAVPFVSVKRADLDGVRADIAQELSQKAEKLQNDLEKLRDKALEKASMTAAGKARIVKNFDGFMNSTIQQFTQNPTLLSSPAARGKMMQDYERAMDRAFIQSNVNGKASADKLRADLGDRASYGAYTTSGKRLNRSNEQVIKNYTENEEAGVDPLDLVVRSGTEAGAYAEVDKLLKAPTSTSGGDQFASVGVEAIQGSNGERYTVGRSGGATTTSNAARLSELRAAMLGYSTKDKKTGKTTYHAGNWKKLISEEGAYGLLEPRMSGYDSRPLVAGELVKVQLLNPQTRQVDDVLIDPTKDNFFTGRSRREVLQYLESHPSDVNNKALRQLEHNREELAEADVRSQLATKLGLQLVNGTVRQIGLSASKIAEPKAAKETGLGGTSVFDAAGGDSSANPGGTLESLPVLDNNGMPATTQQKNQATGKMETVPVKINPSVRVITGAEGIDEWLNKAIHVTGYVMKDGVRTQAQLPKTLANYSPVLPIFHRTPQGMRQVQGGAKLGMLKDASSFRIIGHNGTVTWMASDADSGIAGRERQKAIAEAGSKRLGDARGKNQIDEATYQRELNKLEMEARKYGVMPYIEVEVATSENALMENTRPASTTNEDKHVSRFGHWEGEPGKGGRVVRPDQFMFAGRNDNTKLAELGWTKMSNAETDQAGMGDMDKWTNNGMFGSVFKTTMFVPAANIRLNSSGKVANENVGHVEAENNQQANDEVRVGGGMWGPPK